MINSKRTVSDHPRFMKKTAGVLLSPAYSTPCMATSGSGGTDDTVKIQTKVLCPFIADNGANVTLNMVPTTGPTMSAGGTCTTVPKETEGRP
jgi:hypothetical protein